MQILVIPVGIYDIWRRRRPMLYRELQIAQTSSTRAESLEGEKVLGLMINVSRVQESGDDDDGTVTETELFFPESRHNGHWQCHCLTDGLTD